MLERVTPAQVLLLKDMFGAFLECPGIGGFRCQTSFMSGRKAFLFNDEALSLFHMGIGNIDSVRSSTLYSRCWVPA